MQFQLDSLPPLPLRDVRLVREMGAPVRWEFVTTVTRDTRQGDEVAPIAHALAGGRVKGHAVVDGRPLGPDATISGASWVSSAEGEVVVDRLDFEAVATRVVTEEPNPFLPRRRVHRVPTMRALIEKFDNVCVVAPGVLREMGTIKFPEADHACIIQDGVSDWNFVGRILDQCNLLRPGDDWLPLTLLGGVDPESTEGHWLLTAGCRQAFEKWGNVQRRTVSFQNGQGSDGFGQFEFGGSSFEPLSPTFPLGASPSVIHARIGRAYSPEEWEKWTTRDLPLFTEDGAMVWKIVDRCYTHNEITQVWNSYLWTLPADAAIVSPIPSERPRPWVGLGKVQQRDSKRYWLKAELPGFETRDGENIVDLRLTTAFSGKDGRKGLHMAPETGTDIGLLWTGRFDDPIVYGGNVRSQDMIFDAPSVFLEELYTGQFADVRVPEIGQVSVESKFGMKIAKTSDLACTQRLHVRADGADLKMSGGIVYTGRG